MDGVVAEIETELLAEVVEPEEAIELALGEDDGFATGNVVGFAWCALDGIDLILQSGLLGCGKNGGCDGAVDPPPCRGASSDDGHEENSTNEEGSADARA